MGAEKVDLLKSKLKNLERLDLFSHGFQFFESLFPSSHDVYQDIQWGVIKPEEFSKGYGLLNTPDGIRSSKRRYDLKNLLRYVGLDIDNFTKIYRVISKYDVIVYGYTDNSNEEFLVIGKRITDGAPMYYQQGTLDTTKTKFQEIQEWFKLKELSQESIGKQQDQNNVAV
jgi:hypothetical protein